VLVCVGLCWFVLVCVGLWWLCVEAIRGGKLDLSHVRSFVLDEADAFDQSAKKVQQDTGGGRKGNRSQEMCLVMEMEVEVE